MYQDNPIPASAGKNFFGEIVHAPAIPQFWPIFRVFLFWLTAHG
jgi:hypothetical protein